MTEEKAPYFVGTRQVPSVTQLIGDNLAWGNKYLLKWYRKNALAGKDPEELRDRSAAIGKFVHKVIEHNLMGNEVTMASTQGFTNQDKIAAKKAVNAAMTWIEDHKVTSCICESRMTHSALRYGGTIDLIASVDGVASIVDWKTSNNIYPKHFIQLAAYAELIDYNCGYYPNVHLVHLDKEYGVPRDKNFYGPTDLSDYWRIFKIILELHELHKMVR